MTPRLPIIALLLALTLAACGAKKDPRDKDYGAHVQRAQDAVLASLKDPDSALFKDWAHTTLGKDDYIVCGRVNARNGFGGYNGYRRFIATASDLEYETTPPSVTFESDWRAFCQ